MKKIIIKATCISALLLSTQGWCGNTSVDLRFGHNTRADVNDSRIKVMHQANNGFYFSVEAAQTIMIRFLVIPTDIIPTTRG